MSTVDERADGGSPCTRRERPEEVLARSTMIGGPEDHVPLTEDDRERVLAVLERYASQGLRVLAVARRRLPDGATPPERREDAERDLVPARAGRPLRSAAAGGRGGRRRAATRPGSASSSSPATTGRRQPRSHAGSGSHATAAPSSPARSSSG